MGMSSLTTVVINSNYTVVSFISIHRGMNREVNINSFLFQGKLCKFT